MNLKTFVITLPEKPDRTKACLEHLKARGLTDFTFFMGWHGQSMGLSTKWTYEVDNPGTGFSIGPIPTGIWCSHYALWQGLNLLPDEHFMVFEDDVKLPENWMPKVSQAISDSPKDFDALYIGSCCAGNRPMTHIKGDVYEVKYPLCTHAIIWAKKALPVLVETQRKIYAPIDISLTFHPFKQLKVYTVLPRICDQFNTELPP